MLVKPEQAQKHSKPKEVTEEGMVMLVKPEQYVKQFLPKEVTEEGIVTLFNPLHPLNNGSLKFEITAKRLYAASQRVL